MITQPVFTSLQTLDVRFPTGDDLAGSDAMHSAPDYSAAYVVLRTNLPGAVEGHGFAFTIGRGNEVQVEAINALANYVVERPVEQIFGDIGAFYRSLIGDSQLRWLGPEKGVIQMAVAAVVNAVWDAYAQYRGKPLWRLLSEMTPEELVRLVDFRYLNDVMTEADALALLRTREATKSERIERLVRDGFPAYTTSAGWLGYDDEKMKRLCREAVADGWMHLKIKVGRDIEDDVRRAAIAREILGPHRRLMFDANQVWEVHEAIACMRRLAPFDPWWIEEPTNPDDVLGHAEIARAIAPIAVAAGEHVANRVAFKQYLQANAMGICQIDACRSGGVNDVLAVLLLAANVGVPVCPHAGGVGLCELVQHLSMFDYVAVSGSMEGKAIEYVDSLHDHFTHPAIVRAGRYRAPELPGFGSHMREESLARFVYPNGAAWRDERGMRA